MAENTFEAKKYLDLTGLSHFWTLAYSKISTELAKKVDKVSGKGLSTNDFTTAEKNKLSGISASAEVNQNAFSNVTVGTTTIASGSKTDTFEIAGGDGVSVSASGKKITISVAGSGGSLEDTSISNGSISGSTISGSTLSGTITNSGTISGGTISGSTLSGTTTASSNSTVDLDAASTVTVPTAAAGDSSKKAASTEFVGTAITNATSGLSTRLGTAEGNITNLQTAVTTLNGNANTAGSVAKAVKDGINDFATKVSDDGTINTFKEMIDYAAAHKNEYSTLSGSVQSNTDAIAALDAKTVDGPTQSVADRIATFADTTGKVIKDSGFTIATSVPANAKFTDTDTKVTSVGGHYTPAEDTAAAITASGGSATNITGTAGKLNVVTGLKRDAKGHIVGVTSANIYSTDNNQTSFTITAGASDDDVVVLSGSNGTNGVSYTASHAKKFSTTGSTYTSNNTTTSISGSGGSGTIKIPQITVDAYGHVTAASDESVTITMPTIPAAPTLSGLGGVGTVSASGTSPLNLNATKSGTTVTITGSVDAMTGATSSADGKAGLVPAPAKGKQGLFLKGDGTWATPTNTTYGAGTGLSLSGTTFNHSNSVTAKTAFGSTATTASANGGKIVVTDVKYDAQGHITGTTDRTITLSQDHTKTSVTAGTAGQSGASSGATLAVPYVTVNADGHVTGYGTHTHTISGFLTTETYKGTVTSVATGKGLTGGTITGSGTIKCNLNSEASLGTIGSTSKLYAVGVDANNKLCVNVPWTTYASMSLDEAKTGTATTARTITAAVLDDKIEDKAATVAITTAEIDAIIAEIG